MKLKLLAASVAAIAIAPLASAEVTVTPLVGYHYSDMGATNDAQREVLTTGKQLYLPGTNTNPDNNSAINKPLDGGVSKESSLYTGAAIGVGITPSTQFQVEYGVSSANGEASEYSATVAANRMDITQEMISGNFLIGAEQFGMNAGSKLKPYLLVGAGQSTIEVENQKTYDTATGIDVEYDDANRSIKAGTTVDKSIDAIGNLGLGAMYRINDAVSIRGEARAIHNFDNNWWEGLALGGVEVALGRAKKAPVVPKKKEIVEEEVVNIIPVDNKPKAVDSDRDGVIDSQDACPGTPMNLVVDARGCPRKVPMSEQLKMELRVFFDNDKSVIKQQYKPEIAKVANKMREFPNATANIEGHASKTGPSARYNQRLSEARAIAVKSALANQFGVNPARMATKGYGYSRPIAPNDTAEGRAMNRRVYAIITGDKSITVDETKGMTK